VRALSPPLLWLLLGVSAPAAASEAETPLTPNLDTKLFWTGVFPDDTSWMGSGILNLRGRLTYEPTPNLKFEAHHVLNGQVSTMPTGEGLSAGSGVGRSVPQWVDLNWEEDESAGLTVLGQTDRLLMKATLGSADLTVGRQAITFGTGRFFTPIDLVNPFHPATVDTEYKPGTDAFRGDLYLNSTSVWTHVLAYTGTEEDDAWVYASYGGWTLGVTDMGLFVATFFTPQDGFEEQVVGLSSASSVGPFGLYGDAAVTLAEEDPFARAVLGADYRPTSTTTLNVEAYYQGNGATSVEGYLDMFTDERVSRGEIWALGQSYAALAVMQKLTPTLNGSLAALANLQDASGLLLPSLDVSVSDEVAWTSGAYLGLGAPPDEEGLQSEFGLYPSIVFTQMRAYF
jgi:hypothetical protein